MTLSYERKSVADVVKNGDEYTVTLDDNSSVKADHVVMALGHVDNDLDDEQKVFAAAADENADLLYVAPTHPSEADLDAVPAREKVVLRGLGLSFFDYIAKLTISRGGRFSRDNNGVLYYLPSGKEPHMIAGSRKGLPMHARGVNQKVEVTNQSSLRTKTWTPWLQSQTVKFLTMNSSRYCVRNWSTSTTKTRLTIWV